MSNVGCKPVLAGKAGQGRAEQGRAAPGNAKAYDNNVRAFCVSALVRYVFLPVSVLAVTLLCATRSFVFSGLAPSSVQYCSVSVSVCLRFHRSFRGNPEFLRFVDIFRFKLLVDFDPSWFRFTARPSSRVQHGLRWYHEPSLRKLATGTRRRLPVASPTDFYVGLRSLGSRVRRVWEVWGPGVQEIRVSEFVRFCTFLGLGASGFRVFASWGLVMFRVYVFGFKVSGFLSLLDVLGFRCFGAHTRTIQARHMV